MCMTLSLCDIFCAISLYDIIKTGGANIFIFGKYVADKKYIYPFIILCVQERDI